MLAGGRVVAGLTFIFLLLCGSVSSPGYRGCEVAEVHGSSIYLFNKSTEIDRLAKHFGVFVYIVLGGGAGPLKSNYGIYDMN